MGRMGSGSHGRGLSQASHVGAAATQDAAERIFPRARIRVVPGRSGRARSGGEIQPDQQLPVGQRLSASRGKLASFGGSDRARDGRIARRRTRENPRPQCGAVVQVRRRHADEDASRPNQGGELSRAMPAAEFAHRYANLTGVRIHFVTLGNGAPVVLIHGWPQTWYEWRRVMPLLASDFLLVAPDLRGLGDSSRPSKGYDKKT